MFNAIGFGIGSRRKKKGSAKIVSPDFYKNTTTEQPKSPQSNNSLVPESSVSTTKVIKKVPEVKVPTTPTAIKLTIDSPRSSALSLKSIQEKKRLEAQKIIKKEVLDPSKMPKNEFTETQLLELWNTYGQQMERKGERIIASLFSMNKPTLLENFVIHLELPNKTMEADVAAIEKPLLRFLYEELNNYSISLQTKVNEAVAKKHAFTPQDKYDKLKETNPLIDLLRAKLDLDF